MSEQKDCKFHVIELFEPPYTDPERYVCVPNSWVRLRETSDGVAVVKFPIEELSDIKKRAKKGEFSDDWKVFLADIKYSTNAYKDASNYIKILNKITDQKQKSTKIVNDIPSTSDQKVLESQPSSETNEVHTASTLSSDAKQPVEKETTEQLNFIDSEVEICQEKIQVGIFDSSPKPRRYFTRQSLRTSLSANNPVTLLDQPARDNRPNTSKCVEESNMSDKNHNQKNESSVNSHLELLRKWQVLVVLRSVLGDDFKEVLKQLRYGFEKSHLMLECMRLAFVKNCKITEELIRLTDAVINGPDIIGIGATVEELEKNTMEMDVNENNSDELQNVAQKEEKKNHNSDDAEVLVAALRSVLGDDFKEVLKKLHKEYESNHLMLETMRLACIKICEPIDELIKLTDEVINGPDVSDLGAKMKELENSMMEVDINKNNSNEVTGPEVQNDTQKQKKKKHVSDGTEVKNNNPLNKIRGQVRKFTFPPEYDPNDSRWTLKHRKKKKGLIELVPDSRVYVDAIELDNCKIMSKDSKTLARTLLLEIFSKNALSVCSLTGKRANAFDFEGTSVRPGLDEHAINVLLNYVKKHALRQKWAKFEKQEILHVLRNKIQEMRGKCSYG